MCVLASCLDPGTLLVLCEHMADHFLFVTVTMPKNIICYVTGLTRSKKLVAYLRPTVAQMSFTD